MKPDVKKSPTMRALTARLKEIQLSFSDIDRFVQLFKETTSSTEVEIRLTKLDELWESFSEALVDIFSHDDYNPDSASLEKERMEFSDRYYQLKTFLADKLKEMQKPQELEASFRGSDGSTHGGMDHVRLPQITLQSFNGNIDEWLSFRDLFTSLIHWKTELPEVEKFHYLKGCLQGEPRALIDPLPITKANYQVAWDLLLKRYNNSRQLKKRQVQALFELPSLSKESGTELHVLLEGFERIVKTLDQVIQPVDYKDLLLVHILTARLDPVTRRGWEEVSSTKQQDTIEDLREFLQRRIQVLDCLPSKSSNIKGTVSVQQQTRPKTQQLKSSYSSTQSSRATCVVCSSDHFLYHCKEFQRLTVADRDNVLKSNGLCRNCFRSGHLARDCPSKYSCKNCKGRHHTLVCFKSEREKESKVAAVAGGNKPSTTQDQRDSSNSSSIQVANVASSESVVSATTHQPSVQVLLATAVVVVEDDKGNRFPARALLDSGSESNFITERLSQQMKVIRNRVDISVLGIGQTGTKVKHRIRAMVRSRLSSFAREMDFLILPKVTVNLPTTTTRTENWSFPSGVQLADPAFFERNGVDLVLGIEHFFDFFQTGQRISLGVGNPTLNESVFGWIVSGGISASNHSLQISCNASTLDDLDALISRFWLCEEIESGKALSLEEKRCEDNFRSTVQRETDGRYTVSLPKQEDAISRLGESRDIAYRRLQGTERRLAQNQVLRKQYHDFMEEYVNLGHMRLVERTEMEAVKRCYLPHHPVIKEASTTTKVRVVFDASCKTATGVSLNDVLLAGPTVQEDLRSIILRSRTKQIMLVSDVEKMFRQIYVDPKDRPLQCILWRFSPSDVAHTYELNTVTYGTKPAPYLATKTLQQLALDEEKTFPLAAKAVIDDTYMDDVITGSDEVETAIEMQRQLSAMSSGGGFRLRKWASNCPTVLEGVPEEDRAIRTPEGIELDPDPSIKTLGLTWMPGTDTLRFQFTIPTLDPGKPLTKRCVLSVIATLFDPLGLLGAAITSAKIFMQLLWTLHDGENRRLGWDQPLPSTVGESWKRLYKQLPLLNQIRIDRCVIIPKAVSLELHCFSDASEKAYGACLYARSLNAAGEVKIRLLTSRSKVAPLKCQTIPRLELCGAVLAALLFEKVKHSIRFTGKSFFWTDSTCVLRWIEAVPTTWTTFVANRVAKIQSITEYSRWNHVPGVENPADLISRGITPEGIVENQFWWRGPPWLEEEEEKWPCLSEVLPPGPEEDQKRRTVVAAASSSISEFNQSYFSKFSSYTDLVRRTAYWLRLMKILRTPKKERKSFTFLSTAELREAENTLVRLVQKEVFVMEWRQLASRNPVLRGSPLRWFNPFIDDDQLIRLGGRLQHSLESEETKHPAVLPARHQFTRLLLRHYHERLIHAGPQLLLSVIRLRFWPLGGRSVVKQIVHQCLKCYRSNPRTVQQLMGNLPASRVTVSRPFLRTGVDYFGPLYVRPGPRRPVVKAYVAIFICMTTKAVHMELVSDLSTDRFLQALRRFISRRGRCTDIFSDNGTNFVGARNKLQELLRILKDSSHHETVSSELAKEGIQWHFNPPSAPHFGGLWEAAVRSAKNHLIKVLGETPATPEDLCTLLVQVEACLNSRPLTPLSNDPNDLQPLTPAHFLIGESLHALPETDLTIVPTNRLNMLQLMQRRLQDFWKRWKREYLCQLQGRAKRWKPAIPIDVGTLVVIHDDNLPPLKWKLGRIVKVHPGDDGTVRVVTLKTATGLLTRPVEKICILPVPADDSIEEPSDSATQT